jgi:hypothetical protein
MKAIIENPIITIDYNNGNLPSTEIMTEFILLVNIILSCDNKNSLRSHNLLNNREFKHFMFGFGGYHFWVKQIINDEPKQQVLFVNFL